MNDINALQDALRQSPDNVPLMLLLAKAYVNAFQLDQARDCYERALQADTGNVHARLGMANIASIEGKTSEAAVRLQALCADAPDLGAAWIMRAEVALQEEDAVEARAYYDRAVTADPGVADSGLLKRIEAAGGTGTGGEPPAATPLATGDGYGAGYADSRPGADLQDVPLTDDIGVEFSEKADIDFSQVGGMEGVKDDIRMKIIHPLNNRELFEAYGKKPGGGVLLYGPPGCGKTLISRATAGEINAQYLSVGLHQILDMWIGRSEEKLHEIFEFARSHAPAVIFFDEVDALASDRKDMRTSAGRTLINQFLAELDGTNGNNDGVLVLGATNAPWHLDGAFLRPGRFDRVIFVPPPDEPAREAIINIMASDKPISGLNPSALAEKTRAFSGADIKAVFDQAVEAALAEAMKSGKVVPVTAKQLGKAAKRVKPSTRKWFESAKNYALYSNQSGFYDDVIDYMGQKK